MDNAATAIQWIGKRFHAAVGMLWTRLWGLPQWARLLLVLMALMGFVATQTGTPTPTAATPQSRPAHHRHTQVDAAAGVRGRGQ